MREAHLRDFIAVIDTGSVRSAARKLGLTQAAISKNLSALERSLGVPLLVRSAHGVEATEYGQLVLRRARIVDAELRRLQEELDTLAGRHHGWVELGLSDTAEAMLLPVALERFRQSNPGVMVSLIGGRSSSTLAALRESRIDFAVGPLPPGDAATDLNVERLCSSELGIVVRSGHPEAGCADLARLGNYGWVFAVRQGIPSLVTLFLQRGLTAPLLAAHCDSNSALISMLLQTDVVTLISVAALEPLISRGLLEVLPIAHGMPPLVQNLVTSASRPLTAAASSLASEFRRASRRLRR